MHRLWTEYVTLCISFGHSWKDESLHIIQQGPWTSIYTEIKNNLLSMALEDIDLKVIVMRLLRDQLTWANSYDTPTTHGWRCKACRSHPMAGLALHLATGLPLTTPNEGGTLRSLRHAVRHYRLGQWRLLGWAWWMTGGMSFCLAVLWNLFIVTDGAYEGDWYMRVRNALLWPATALISPPATAAETIDKSKSCRK